MKVSSLALLATVGAGRTTAFLAPAPVQLGRQSKVLSPSHNNHFFVVSDPVAEHAVTDARALVDSQDVSASETAKEIPTMMTTTTTTTPTTTTTTTNKTDRAATSGANAPIVPGRYAGLDYSLTIPLLSRPPHLDGTHAGDYGFDPCGLSETFDLYYMQECELRHARLAMLAAVGWPLSELWAPSFMLVSVSEQSNNSINNGLAPSVLNGFNPISAVAVLGFLAAVGLWEFNTSLRRTATTELGAKHRRDMEPVWEWGVAGDYNFDPLGWYNLLGDDAAGRRAMRSVEISHGRWAMVGITGFASLEALSGRPVVEQFGLFFHPNPVVPLVAVAYLVWSQFYQVSDVREYPIRIEYTKDGEEMLRGVRRTLAQQQQQSKDQ